MDRYHARKRWKPRWPHVIEYVGQGLEDMLNMRFMYIRICSVMA